MRIKNINLPPLTPNVDPQLKPSQPHHNINVPNTTFVGEAIIWGFACLLKIPCLNDDKVQLF